MDTSDKPPKVVVKPSPPKTEVLCHPSRWRSIRENGGLKLRRILCFPLHPRYRHLSLSPISCSEEKGFHLLDLPCVPKGRFKQLLFRGVRECWKKGSAGWDLSLVPPGGNVCNNLIHNSELRWNWGSHPGGG